MSEELTGREWMERFSTAQGQVQFNLQWLVFRMGQLGVMLEHDKPTAKLLAEEMGGDVQDVLDAAHQFAAIAGDMLTNARRNAG